MVEPGLLQTGYLLLIAVTTGWLAAGLFAIWRIRRTSASDSKLAHETMHESITVLKPLCGADHALESNLRSFFEQDHPAFELVFGVQGAEDPAIEVVRTLQQAYPAVTARLVVHARDESTALGLNPKVSNLRATMPFVHSDLVVVSDSNIRVHAGYLRELIATYHTHRAGLVTSLIAGEGSDTVGARLDALHLNAEIAAGAAIPTALGNHPVVVGKSMLLRMTVLEKLGGLASVAHVLAEDYVIGRMFHQAGYRIAVAPTPITNVCGQTTLRGFVMRHVRWGMIRLRMQPLAYVVEPLSHPWFVALLAPVFGVSWSAALVWALVLSTVRDLAQAKLLKTKLSMLDLGWTVLRDALAFVAWLVVPFRRHILWRQTRVRVSAGTRLYEASQVARA